MIYPVQSVSDSSCCSTGRTTGIYLQSLRLRSRHALRKRSETLSDKYPLSTIDRTGASALFLQYPQREGRKVSVGLEPPCLLPALASFTTAVSDTFVDTTVVQRAGQRNQDCHETRLGPLELQPSKELPARLFPRACLAEIEEELTNSAQTATPGT